MIKDIVAHLTGDERDAACLAAAEQVAARFDGHLTGLFPNLLPSVVAPYEGSAAAAIAQWREEAIARGNQTETCLKERMNKLGVLNELRRFDASADTLDETLTAEARTADLFVTAQPLSVAEPFSSPQEAVLFGSGRATLFVPPSGTPDLFGPVLLAWKNTREAARATAEAMPFLKACGQVTVLVVEEHSSRERGEEAGADIGRHLSRHGIATEVRTAGGWSNPGEALLSEVKSTGAGLLVMGAYGHSRFREWVLGGVTRHISKNASVPVLMAR